MSVAACRSTPCAVDMTEPLSQLLYLPGAKAVGAFVLLEQNRWINTCQVTHWLVPVKPMEWMWVLESSTFAFDWPVMRRASVCPGQSVSSTNLQSIQPLDFNQEKTVPNLPWIKRCQRFIIFQHHFLFNVSGEIKTSLGNLCDNF